MKNLAWSNLSNEEFRAAIALYSILIAKGEYDTNTFAARGYAYSMVDEHALAAQGLQRCAGYGTRQPDGPE